MWGWGQTCPNPMIVYVEDEESCARLCELFWCSGSFDVPTQLQFSIPVHALKSEWSPYKKKNNLSTCPHHIPKKSQKEWISPHFFEPKWSQPTLQGVSMQVLTLRRADVSISCRLVRRNVVGEWSTMGVTEFQWKPVVCLPSNRGFL